VDWEGEGLADGILKQIFFMKSLSKKFISLVFNDKTEEMTNFM
jgi:hypothetical protein